MKSLLICFSVLAAGMLSLQAGGVTGTVTNSAGRAVSGVTVSCKEFDQTTHSTRNGAFVLALPDDAVGQTVTIVVDKTVKTLTAIPKKGYATLNIVIK